MKKNQLSLMFKASLFMLALVFAFSSCKKDDDDEDPPVTVEDGMYIRGDATPFTALNLVAMMEPGINEANEQTTRPGMYEKYTTLKQGSTFNIVEVAGTTQTSYGPATNETVVLEGQNDQIHGSIQKGTIGTSGTFSVPADGMYHIIFDKPNNVYVIAPVAWGIIGGFSGWSHVDMPLVGSFNANEMKWETTGITMRAGDEFKFRYSNGWKLEIAGDSVKANTNFGGTVEGTPPTLVPTLERGGANYATVAANEGIYTVTITWTAANGYSSTLVKTAEAPPLGYPEQLYIIGNAVNGWEWTTDAVEMIPVHSFPNLFWRILWLQADSAFKFSPEMGWTGSFGKTGDIADGIWERGNDDIPAPATSGYYMVTVNLETQQIAITEPMVYLIGETVGSDEQANPENLFTVDNANELITITKDLLAGDIRMYAWMDKGWFSAWWQSEFNIYDGVIEYRGKGNDQPRIPVTAGNTTVNLNFRNDTGSIVVN